MLKKIIFLLCLPLALAQAGFKIAGTPVRLIGDAEQPFMRPIWSSTGNYIACTGEGYRGIWLLHLHTRELRQLSDASSAGFGMCWSADGRSLAARISKFQGWRRANAIQLFDVESQTAWLVCPFQNASLGLPAWSYDDSRIYVTVKNKLQAFDTGKRNTALKKAAPQTIAYLKGDELNFYHPITTTSLKKLSDQRVINLTTSPDGSRIAFEMMGGPLCVMNSDARGLVELGDGHRPQWSPDGQHLVYMITQDDGHRIVSSDLCVIKTDGSEKQQLTQTMGSLEMNPCWSPDGNQIAYDDAGDGAIYILTLVRE